MKTLPILSATLVCAYLAATPLASSAQQVNSTSKETRIVASAANVQALRREMKESLELKVLSNALLSFGIKDTPDVHAKLPRLGEMLTDNIAVRWEPSDGESLTGVASIAVDATQLKKLLSSMEIGAGDIAASNAKVLVSIDEFVGVATQLDGSKPTETEFHYAHDKTAYSDRSATAAGAQSASSSSASASRESYAAAASQKAAVTASSSSSVAGRDRQAYAASGAAAMSVQDGYGGSMAGARSTQVAAAKDTQYAAAQRGSMAASSQSQYAASGSSEHASASKSARSSSYASSQKDVQLQKDIVQVSIKTKMPEFDNAKSLGAQDRVLAGRLSGEFQNNGLVLVSESDLRSEGGRVVPVYEIVNNGRVEQFVSRIQQKSLNADVWATGTASYNIVGTANSQTSCNGSLSVQARFLSTNTVFFEDALRAEARGNGDQDCRANLGIALATSLAKVLGPRANEAMNAKNSRGSVWEVYLYSSNSLKRSVKSKFAQEVEKIPGVKMSEPADRDRFSVWSIQYSGGLKKSLDGVLDNMGWDDAKLVDKGGKICIGIEGLAACPQEFR